MEFFAGVITGLVVALFLAVVVTAGRKPIERGLARAERAVSPPPKGYIFDAPDQAEELRREHIEKNSREGKDTKLSELL